MDRFLEVPLKKSSDTGIVKPLKKLISSFYTTTDKPKNYTEAINEFNTLRNNARRVYEKIESSLKAVNSYYDQLSALEEKVPSHKVQIPFKWTDAFSNGSIFHPNSSLTVSSIAYEKVCVLFNIGAIQSSVAAAQNTESEDGLKLAAKMFQQAAGLFSHLKETVMLAIQRDLTPDLKPETLGALSALMLAQGQEIFVKKAIRDNIKDALIAKLSSQCAEMYAQVLGIFQNEVLKPLWDKKWIAIMAAKQAAYHGLAEYYQSLVCRAKRTFGEEIARLEHALGLFKATKERSRKSSFFQDYVNRAQRNLTEAKKDNDFIYYQTIPDIETVPPVGKALLAKTLPLPQRLSEDFKDLFEELILPVREAMAAYDARKNEIVNSETEKLREGTQFLDSVLASLDLPEALDCTSGNSLPQSLLDKSSAVRDNGGIQELERIIQELPELVKRNTDILDDIERMVHEEQESDDKLRTQFKERWTRTPSGGLTGTFRASIAKYRTIISNAMQNDEAGQKKFENHRRGIEVLTKGLDEMLALVRSTGPEGSGAESSPVQHLRKLLEDVETLKAERDTIGRKLRSATVDMKSTFLKPMARDGVVDEPAISAENLGKAFAPLQHQVNESLQEQETLVAEILATDELRREKDSAAAAALEELATASDAFTELRGSLPKGAVFHSHLTQTLMAFKNKISSFCLARKTEKEKLTTQLAKDTGRKNVGTTPAIPRHHAQAQDRRKQPPLRPPAPTSTPGSAATRVPRRPRTMGCVKNHKV
jgi:programmed cell death 6-interacting protein